MKKLFLVLLACCLLFWGINADASTITFGWAQPDLAVGNTTFEGWGMFYRQGATGTFAQLGSVMVWDGSAKPEYQGSWTLTAPAGQETTYYFLCRAKNKDAAGGQWSGDSNIVSLLVDLKAPTKPVVTTTIPATVPVGTFTVSGTKEANSSIWINGTEIVPNNSATTWTATLNVVKGNNAYTITSKDAAPWLNESASTSVTFQGTEAPATPVQLKVNVVAQ
jgi:hypothetical protein